MNDAARGSRIRATFLLVVCLLLSTRNVACWSPFRLNQKYQTPHPRVCRTTAFRHQSSSTCTCCGPTRSRNCWTSFDRRRVCSRLGWVRLSAVLDKSAVLDNEKMSLPDLSDHSSSSASGKPASSSSTTAAAAAAATSGWMARAQQLHEYYCKNGHTLVPKRYKPNPSLGNWVNKQRQLYRARSLTPQRVDILNKINFSWEAKHSNSSKINGSKTNGKDDDDDDNEEDWWLRFNELRQSNYTRVADVPRGTPLGKWIHRQRKQHVIWRTKCAITGNTAITAMTTNTTMNNNNIISRLDALDNMDPDWYLTPRELQWEHRYRELQDYQRQHGDCCVPMSYSNKQLAYWVSNQRKQMLRRQAGKASHMTANRQERLQAIGFAWNRWDFEFQKKGLVSL